MKTTLGATWKQGNTQNSLGPSEIAGEISFYFFGPLSGSFTFSRAGTEQYYDDSGVLQTAAANVPCFDHDPSTHTPLGLLLNGATATAPDNLTLSLPYAGFPGAAGWTAVLEFVPLALPGGGAEIFGLSALSGAADTTFNQLNANGTTSVFKIVSSSSSNSLVSPVIISIGAVIKSAAAQDIVDAHIAVNGSLYGIATNAGYPTMTALGVGRASYSASRYQPMLARRLRLWPRKLSDAELQTVTS